MTTTVVQVPWRAAAWSRPTNTGKAIRHTLALGTTSEPRQPQQTRDTRERIFSFFLPWRNMSRKRSIIHLLSSLKTAYAGTARCQSNLAGTAAPRTLPVRNVDEAGSAPFRHVTRTYTTITDTDTAEKDTIHIADEVYNRQRNVLPLLNRIVHAAPSAYIAPSAVRLALC
jgi:hypothetical protein